jgi:alkylation response protein AidB-like acyl-CoA dehydrogenase
MTASQSPFALAEELERFFGDPRSEEAVFSYARCADSDAREEFPAEICQAVDRWGLPAYYVPTAFGGRLDNIEQVLNGMRMVARRDLTVAVAHGKTFLGSICTWIAGPPALARRLADMVIDGAPVSWGLTERDHGSDLLAGDVSAQLGERGFAISGEKWLINNATRGRLVSLLVRTSPAGGPRGFDMLLVDKHTPRPGKLPPPTQGADRGHPRRGHLRDRVRRGGGRRRRADRRTGQRA